MKGIGASCFTDATLAACRAVVAADASASPQAKQHVQEILGRLLKGEDIESAQAAVQEREPTAVLTYPAAARMLGYRNSRGVYKLVRKGLLDAVYGSRDRKRSHGVTRRSVERHLGL